MRTLRSFEYFRPRSVEEAAELLHHYQDEARVLAGGTDLLVSMKRRAKRPAAVVDIKGLPGLTDLVWDDAAGLRIGALYTVGEMARQRGDAPPPLLLLAQGARAIGHPQIRNRATVAGNLCNASPSADMAPALLALGATLRIISRDRHRLVPLEEFFTSPFRTVLAPDELVTEITIPAGAVRTGADYAWLPKITAVDETLASAAAVVTLGDYGVLSGARIALGSVGPTPLRAWKAEAFLEGQRVEDSLLREAAQIAASETTPHSRAEYRRHLTGVLVERALRRAIRLAA